MPIEFTPPRRLLAAYMRLRQRVRGESPQANQIKPETVEAVNDDGTYRIRGRNIGTAGNAAINAGERVDVAWKNARPVAILAHNARRAQFAPRMPGGVPVVEVLFYQVRPEDGVPDIYFRNAFECVPLNLPKLVPTANFNNSVPLWGLGQDRFFTDAADIAPPFTVRTYVFKFTRNPFEPFTGPGAAGRVKLDYVFDGSTDTTPIATVGTQVFSLSNLSPPGPATLAVIGNSVLDIDGSLILNMRLQINFTVGTNPVVPHGPGDAFTTEFFNFGTFQYPIVYDAKNKVVLLSAFDNPTVLGPGFPAMPVWGGSFAANVTWTLQGSFVTDARNTARFPFPPTGITINQYCGQGTTPGVVSLALAPTLVTGKTSSDRLRGWIACYQDECQTWSGQSSVPFGGGPSGSYGYVVPFPDQMPLSCADVGSTFTPARVAAGARAPLTGAVIMVIPFQDQPGASALGVGFVAVSTLNRLIWRKDINGQVTMQVDLDSGGSDTEGFITFYGTENIATVTSHFVGHGTSGTSGLRGSVGAHGVAIAFTDFAYQMDNPRISFKTGAKVNYFLQLWPFIQPSPLADLDALAVSPDQSHNLPFVPGLDYPADGILASAGKLADLPKGVTIGATGSGRAFALQVVNSVANLPGHYEVIPT